MRVNLVSNADVQAISIVDKGANRKQFFLRKADAEGATPLGHGRLVKAEDWSAVYCVVAEPGWAENSGIGGPDIDDVWASEEEIRKAAHKFMANGALVNKMHESLEPYGQLVENAVALADFTVNGQTILKGSWYIAIAPSEDGKAAIEKGEFTGVSIEGFARREEVEKGSTSAERTVGHVEKNLLRKMAEKMGLTAEEIESIEKANLTFGDIVTQREFEDALPEAFDAFREAVWRAFFPSPEEDFNPTAHLSQSCDEFKTWALGMLDAVPVSKTERAEALGVTLDGSTPQLRKFESEDTEMALTEKETQRIEALEKSVGEIGEGVAELLKAAKPEPEAPTVESVAESVSELSKGLDGIKADIAKLGSGGSSQTDDPPASEVTKADEEKLRKAFENEGVNPDLAGVL